jgi:hypothetical protein
MSGSRVQAWLSGERPRLLWIDFDRYARRVFAGSEADWHRSAAQQAAMLVQAHRVVPSEVVALGLWEPLLRASAPDADAAQALEGDRGRLFLAELVDATAHHLGERADLVLRLPAPQDIVLGARRGPGAPGFDELDDAMLGVTALLRSLSGKPIAGLVVDCAGRDLHGDELEALDSVAAAARHYGWFVAVASPAAAPPAPWCAVRLDAERAPGAGQGGGLGRAFWSNAVPPPPIGLLYGEVPDEVSPEEVVRAVARLTR